MTADDLERLVDELVRVYVQTMLVHESKRPTPGAVLFYRERMRRALVSSLAPRRSAVPSALYGEEEVTPAESPTARRRALGRS